MLYELQCFMYVFHGLISWSLVTCVTMCHVVIYSVTCNMYYRASVEGMLSVVTRILAAQDMDFVEKMKVTVTL